MIAMMDRQALGRRAEAVFSEQWSRDHWELHSLLDRDSYSLQQSLLEGRRYDRALEIGCGTGMFTERLAPLADSIVAVDVAPNAIQRARARHLPSVDFRVANVMDFDPVADGPWDLIVMSETIYCVGWLYPFFEVGWMLSSLFAATRPGGRFLMANTYGHARDYLLLPFLIDSYRDLCLNVGFEREYETVFHGAKNGVEMDILVSLMQRPPVDTDAVG